jgi:hypothetical protein
MIPYTEEELEFISKTLKEQNKRAEEAVKKRGVQRDPRIAAAKLK